MSDPNFDLGDSAFNVDELTEYCTEVIREFAAAHASETFYGFALDEGLLCLNSVEAFEATLADFERRWPGYSADPRKVSELKWSTGDWVYQGFADMAEWPGYDDAAQAFHAEYVLEHVLTEWLDSETETELAELPSANVTAYAQAMNALLARLKAADAFKPLRRTDDFRAFRCEHTF
ncbi:MAG: DUF4303 domain-containing protein [Roseivivax sp.]|nr:DUF4303 domain-containing protein [Roseivivax sp.]